MNTVTQTNELQDPFAENETIPQVKVSVPAGVWTTLKRGDDAALAVYAASIGTTHENIKLVLDNESIVSKGIKFLDITDQLENYIDPSEPMLVGQVTKDILSQGTTVTRGFTFEGTQRVVLAVFSMRTKLEAPDENGITFGTREVVYTLFPDATPGLKSISGSVMRNSVYRPGLRLMLTTYDDDAKNPLWARFNVQPRAKHGNVEKAEFALQLPQYLFGAALIAGATKEELCMIYASRSDKTLESQAERMVNGRKSTAAPRASYAAVSELS